MEKGSKKEFYNREFELLHCNSCNSNLIIKYLNQSQQILLCSNNKVRKLYNKIFFMFIVHVSIRFL